MPVQELQAFREKYPAYDDLSDIDLAMRLAEKYPDAYSDLPAKARKDAGGIVADRPNRDRGFIERQISPGGIASPESVGALGGGAIGMTAGTPFGPLGMALGGLAGAGVGGMLGRGSEMAFGNGPRPESLTEVGAGGLTTEPGDGFRISKRFEHRVHLIFFVRAPAKRLSS